MCILEEILHVSQKYVWNLETKLRLQRMFVTIHDIYLLDRDLQGLKQLADKDLWDHRVFLLAVSAARREPQSFSVLVGDT